MKENKKIMRKTPSNVQNNSPEKEVIEKEDREIYLFLRGGFAAK